MKNFKYIFYERRHRLKRPLDLKLFTGGTLLIPVYCYVKKMYMFGFYYTDYFHIINSFSITQLIVCIGAVLACFFILLGFKPVYYITLLMTLAFIFYNLYNFFDRGEIFNLESVFMAFYGTALFVYLTSPNHSAPFRRRCGKGFRRELRRSFHLSVVINEKKRVIENISSRGMLLRWKDPRISLNREVELALILNRQKFVIAAGIVRKDSDSVALAFRHLDKKVRKLIYNRLKHIEESKSNEHENL